MRVLVLAAALAVTPLAWSQDSLVGKEAGTFKAGEMVNPVPARNLEDCWGEVILIKYWGLK